MKEKVLNFPEAPKQKFTGTVETKTFKDEHNPEIEQSIDLLTAELDMHDGILIDEAQPVNPALGSIAGQPVLAVIELPSRAEQADSKTATIYIARVDDAENPAFKDFERGAGVSPSKSGALFIHYIGDTQASAFIPDSYAMAFIGPNSNLEWMEYPKDTLNRLGWGPVRSADKVNLFFTQHGVLTRNSGKGSVVVKTRASEEHKEIVAATFANQDEPHRAAKKQKVGHRLRGLVKI